MSSFTKCHNSIALSQRVVPKPSAVPQEFRGEVSQIQGWDDGQAC